MKSERESLGVEHNLTPGSLLVTRYVYTNPNGTSGVQWLAQRVEKDGSVAMIEACKTRREALEVVARD